MTRDRSRTIRNHIACESTMTRTIAGKRFLFKTNMWGSFLAVYRFDAQHGEIAIPCGLVARDKVVKYPGEPSETYWPKDQPRDTPWIWTDKNGDGQIQKEELVATKSGSTWDVDANGDIWSASNKIYHHRFQGLDERGTPRWDTTPRRSAGRPRSTATATNCAGSSTWRPPTPCICAASRRTIRTAHGMVSPWPGVFSCGMTIGARNPVPGAQIAFPHDSFSGGAAQEGVDVAGDYLFTVSLYDARVSIYDVRNGNLVGTMVAGPEIAGFSGWVDMPFSLSAYKQANGEYLVLAEEDGRNKEIIYRWKPDLSAPPVPPTLTADEGRLSWTSPMTMGSFNLYRGRPGSKPELYRRNLMAGTFADPELLEGSYCYHVTSVNAAGESAPSDTVILKGSEADLVELKGQVFASKLAAEKGREPEKAFDDDPATQYRILELNGGYVGIDLGAGKARRVVKIRFWATRIRPC